MTTTRTLSLTRRISHRFAIAGCVATPLLLVTLTTAVGLAAPTSAGKTVTATIQTNRQYQTIVGFGAATAYYQNWITAHPNKKALYDTFFRGLNLAILRLPNNYRPDKGRDFAKDDADIVRAAQASLGHPISIVMSSWSPPAALKSTGDEKHGGTLARENGAYVYGKFAAHWADSLSAYRRIGITPKWICIQNEPDWQADWETCRFQPREGTDDKGVAYAGYDKALDAVYRRFRSLPNAPRILGPETLGIGGNKVQNYLGPRTSAPARQVSGVAYHLYYGGDHQQPDTFIPALRSIRDDYPDKPKWMTEFGRSDGFQTAWCIHNTLTEGNAVAYVYWAAMWPGPDTLITLDNPFARSTWKLPNGFQPTDRYYGLKHYSYFIRPGYKRVAVTASAPALKISAFVSPDRSRLVAVALNTSTTTPMTLSLGVPGFSTRRPLAVYRSVLPAPAVTPSQGERVGTNGPGERFQAVSSNSRTGAIALPPHSVVTIVLEHRK